jgi:hypothetical protein
MPKNIVGSRNSNQIIEPHSKLNPPDRVNINREAAVTIARFLKEIE